MPAKIKEQTDDGIVHRGNYVAYKVLFNTIICTTRQKNQKNNLFRNFFSNFESQMVMIKQLPLENT
jgi:hypothetical protein